MSTISETVSEKPKRGRPKLYSDEVIRVHGEIWHETKTRRGLQNKSRQVRAMRALKEVSPEYAEFRWLIDPAGQVKQAIMYELGRLSDDADIVEWAKLLCDHKPKGKEAIAMIRRWRLGESSKEGALALGGILTRAIDDFCRRYPDTTAQQILAALENTADAVQESYRRD